jgi:hypothetical protein
MVFRKEETESESDSLSDEEFVRKYPADGFGWSPAPNPENGQEVARHNAGALEISGRHERLKKERPELYQS